MQRLVRYIFFFILCVPGLFKVYAQPLHAGRFELEKKNTDDYFTVLSAGKEGLVIFRDTDDYRKGEGNIWQVVALDTALTKTWEHELGIDTEFIIKAYELTDSKLYLLFRKGDYAKSDYLLITITLSSGEINKYNIENELELELSHMTVVNDRLILGGYVRFSPTLLLYETGRKAFQVVPGYFKDRSRIVDVRANKGGTFNSVTLEKDYEGYFLRFRTYSSERDILFEREIETDDDHRVLSAKSTGFVNGNIAISGTYTSSNSQVSMGVYFIIVKPEGQKNTFKYYPFSKFEHFFDYMNPKRAKRLEEKIEIRAAEGKEYRFGSRLILHQLKSAGGGFWASAEIFNPKFDNVSRPELSSYYVGSGFSSNRRAYTNYVKQSSQVSNLDQANSYDYKQSLIFKLNKNGELVWDNSFKIEDVETLSLEQVVDISISDEDKVTMLYNHEEELRYKITDKNEVLEEGNVKLELTHENDVVKHNYDGIGGAIRWYGNTFFVWGYHRIENKSQPDVDQKRNVLFINKVVFD